MAVPTPQKESSAYDLSMFEQRAERRTLRVVRNPRPAPSHLFGLSPAVVLFVAVIVVVITSLFIYNNVVLTEIGAQIDTATQEANELQSEGVRLQASLESKMSIKNIEESAESTLGLVKMDRSQIEYINLAPDDEVEVERQDFAQGNIAQKSIAQIKEYLSR
ncbi:MAG: hypothetical protein RSB36_07285 [Hydrogenoanaerobacterium sp.]